MECREREFKHTQTHALLLAFLFPPYVHTRLISSFEDAALSMEVDSMALTWGSLAMRARRHTSGSSSRALTLA